MSETILPTTEVTAPPTDTVKNTDTNDWLLTGLQQLNKVAEGGEQNTLYLAETTIMMEQEQHKINEMEKWLVIVVLVTILFKCVMVYFTYKKMIGIIDSATYKYWPTNGFYTALSVSYPVLSGFFGFDTSSLPSAAYISFQLDTTFSNTDMVKNNPGAVLDSMYEYSQQNSKAGAQKIICDSWAGESGANVGECTAACKGTNPLPGAAASAFSTGLMASFAHGSFMGHTTGAAKAGGMGAFFIGGALLGAATSYWSTTESNNAANSANPACS
jgi:hypothetical protein